MSRQYRIVPVIELTEWKQFFPKVRFCVKVQVVLKGEGERDCFKTGGTTEITDNFVPVDAMFVGFMIFGRML